MRADALAQRQQYPLIVSRDVPVTVVGEQGFTRLRSGSNGNRLGLRLCLFEHKPGLRVGDTAGIEYGDIELELVTVLGACLAAFSYRPKLDRR